MNKQKVLAQIAELQAIQKTHKPTSSAWMQASELLCQLFDFMRKTSIAERTITCH